MSFFAFELLIMCKKLIMLMKGNNAMLKKCFYKFGIYLDLIYVMAILIEKKLIKLIVEMCCDFQIGFMHNEIQPKCFTNAYFI